MKNVLQHKGYSGSVEFSAEDQVFFGKIIGIRDLVTFEGASVREINRSFKGAVDDYIYTCEKLGKHPDQDFKGSFNVRVKAHIHRMVSLRSQALKISLNQYVENVLEKEVMSYPKRLNETSVASEKPKRGYGKRKKKR